MNPSKKDCWILCPSTRMPGKYYYFNVGTGEAAWSMSDVERGMTSRHNLQNAEKWHSYPEPETPPDENGWGYQPQTGYRAYPQHMPSFAQTFPRYMPAMPESPMYNMPWPMPMPSTMPISSTMVTPSMFYQKPPMMNLPMIEPAWPSYPPRPRMPEKNLFQFNPYEMPMSLPNNFSQPQTRPVFGPKFNNVNNTKCFPPNLKRTAEVINVKEPLFKKTKFHEPVNETFIMDNVYGTKIYENNCSEDSTKPKNIFIQPQQHTCHCMLSKTEDKVDSWLSKSQESFSSFNPKIQLENVQLNQKVQLENIPFHQKVQLENGQKSIQLKNISKDAGLSKSKGNQNELSSSDISSNFTLKSSFVFPIKKTQSKQSSKCESSTNVTPIKNIRERSFNNNIEERDDKIAMEDIGQEDLRLVLLAKRKKGYSESNDRHGNTGRVIKTRYTEKPPTETAPKKRVTFDLGINGTSVANGHEDQPINEEELAADPIRTETGAEAAFIVADLDVLLTEFQLVEKYVKSEVGATLLIPLATVRAIQGATRGSGADSARLLQARRLVRLLADPPPYITVQTEEKETELSSSEDPVLICCWQTMELGYFVVLITNNEDLYNKAQALEIECYTTEEVLYYLNTTKPELSFDFKKIDTKKTEANNSNASKKFENTKIIGQDSSSNFPPKSSNKIDSTQNEQSLFCTVPVNCARKQLFSNNNNEKTLFNKTGLLKGPIIQRRFSLGSLELTKENGIDKGDFLDKTFPIRDIEKLKLDEDFQRENTFEALDAKKQNSNFKNSDATKQMTDDKDLLLKNDEEKEKCDHTAKKKIKNINVYNLNELMKEFSVKTREVEDRILSKMEEYVCWFTQIMEDTLLEILKDTPCEEEGDKAPLQSLLNTLREVHSDQRTVTELADKLGATLDSLYTVENDAVMLCLDLRPYQFMKILGYGTLLVRCLLNNEPSNARLQESDSQLESLLACIEGDTEPGCDTPPRSPHRSPHSPALTHGRNNKCSEMEKKTEVLEYLQKHFSGWQSVKDTEMASHIENTKENVPEAKVQEKSGPKIVRTFGKDLGLLKFNQTKNMILTTKDENQNCITKENETKTKNEQESEKITGPKLMKKLALESQELPPKMKDFSKIDIEKREKVNQSMLNMIHDMVADADCQKSTKKIDTEKIILKNSDVKISPDQTVPKDTSFKKVKTVIVKAKNKKSIAPKLSLKRKNNRQKSPETSEINQNKHKQLNNKISELNQDIDSPETTEIDQNKDLSPETSEINNKETLQTSDLNKCKENSENTQITLNKDLSPETSELNKTKDSPETSESKTLDLDKLDYSDIEESLIEEQYDNDIIIPDEDTEKNSPDTQNCLVTTTNNNGSSNEDLSPDNSRESTDNADLGFWKQTYTVVQLFLINFSETFNMLLEFVKMSVCALRRDLSEAKKKYWHERVMYVETTLGRIINNLKGIIGRESREESAVVPLVVRCAHTPAHRDKRIVKYRQVVCKCLEQTEILACAIQIVKKICRDDFDLRSVVDVPSKYDNLFE